MTARRTHILLVEDSPGHAALIRRAFQAQTPEIVLTVAQSLREARQIISESVPDLAVVDLVLPDGQGTELFAETGAADDFPMVVMTSHGDEKVAVRAIKSGAMDYIVKSAATLANLPHIAERSLRQWEHITERRRAEVALRESEERKELALSGADLGMWDWEIQTGKLVTDERWAEILGFAQEEVTPNAQFLRERMHPNDLPVFERAVREHLEGRCERIEAEIRMRARSGAWIWLLIRGRVIERDRQGGAVRLTGTHMDISDHKRLEEERQHLQEELQRSEKLKSLVLMAGSIAHDFNTYLCSVLGNLELARNELPASSAVRPLLHDCEQAARRAAGLSAKMLTYSGRKVFRRDAVSLTELVCETVPVLKSATPANVAIDCELDYQLADISGDAQQLRQVIKELVDNAVEAIGSENGIITIRTGQTEYSCDEEAPGPQSEELDAGLHAFLEVSDSGPGLDQDTLARIFDPFFTTRFLGRGLGLALVDGTVRAHHGAIQTQSRPGVGTDIRILFPFASAPSQSRRLIHDC